MIIPTVNPACRTVPIAVKAMRIGALATGALAVGGLALGALALGAVATGHRPIKKSASRDRSSRHQKT